MYHPLFVKRWAKLYVERYAKNQKEAVAWGLKFFPDDLIPLVVEAAKEELKKRGINPK